MDFKDSKFEFSPGAQDTVGVHHLLIVGAQDGIVFKRVMRLVVLNSYLPLFPKSLPVFELDLLSEPLKFTVPTAFEGSGPFGTLLKTLQKAATRLNILPKIDSALSHLKFI